MAGGRLIALDGLRGVAAIMVMLRHGPGDGVPFTYGYLAVDLFFILSGFVLARTYEPRFAAGLGNAAYLRQRLERLYPMLLIGGLLGLLLFSLGLGEFAPRDWNDFSFAVLGQFLLIPALSSYYAAFAFNGPQWSIVFELIANMLHRMTQLYLTNTVLTALVGILALGTLRITLAEGHLDYGWDYAHLISGTVRALFGFLLGVLLARTQERWHDRIPQLPFLVPALLAAAMTVGPIWTDGPGLMRAGHDLALLFFYMPLLVMVTVRAKPNRLAAPLGTMSYPLYAIHIPLLVAIEQAELPLWCTFAAMAVLPFVAWALGRWVDEPLSKARRARRKSATPPLPAAQPAAAHG